MRALCLVVLCLLLSASAASAATPESWQQEQGSDSQPAIITSAARSEVSVVPVQKDAAAAKEPAVTPQVTAEVQAESAVAPLVTAEAQLEPAVAPSVTAEAQPEPAVAPTLTATEQPTKPAPKPRRILKKLLGTPPQSQQYLRTPLPGDLAPVVSTDGGYSIALPLAFGSDPLADLPQARHIALLRAAHDTLYCAATLLDPTDTKSYQSAAALPSFEDKQVYARWQQDAALTWDCSLSRHNDYHGDKLLLEAQAQQNGKTYQLLYVLPYRQLATYLPQALYSLSSFQLLASSK